MEYCGGKPGFGAEPYGGVNIAYLCRRRERYHAVYVLFAYGVQRADYHARKSEYEQHICDMRLRRV